MEEKSYCDNKCPPWSGIATTLAAYIGGPDENISTCLHCGKEKKRIDIYGFTRDDIVIPEDPSIFDMKMRCDKLEDRIIDLRINDKTT